jgi:hypothetical protein
VTFVAITLCVVSQQVFIVVISLWTQFGNFWIRPRKPVVSKLITLKRNHSYLRYKTHEKVQRRGLVNTIMNLRVPWEFLNIVSDYQLLK